MDAHKDKVEDFAEPGDPDAERAADVPSLQTIRSWAFITSHARVLLAVAQEPELRVEEIAEAASVTERSVYRILADLVEEGYLRRTRVGRRNRYELDPDLLLDDPVVEERTMSDLLSFIGAQRRKTRSNGPAPD
jgi:DNA-binding transcriptional ArsR family regulator